jgi:ubiquitin-protein ligase
VQCNFISINDRKQLIELQEIKKINEEKNLTEEKQQKKKICEEKHTQNYSHWNFIIIGKSQSVCVFGFVFCSH